MAFTPQEEAQLRLIILSFLSGKAIADLENADPATISGALIEVVQNGVSKKTSISEFFTGSPAGVKASLTEIQTEFPTGTAGVYVATDNGHWYFYADENWIDGGLYQSPLDVVQTTGTSETDVMSQKSVTDELVQVRSDLTNEIIWQQGTNGTTPGTIASSGIRCISIVNDTESFIAYKIHSDYSIIITEWNDGDATFYIPLSWFNGVGMYKAVKKNVAIVVKKNDESVISYSNITKDIVDIVISPKYNTAFEAIYEEGRGISKHNNFVRGTVQTSGENIGQIVSSGIRCVDVLELPLGTGISVIANSGYKVGLACYSDGDTNTTATGFREGITTFRTFGTHAYLIVGKTNDSAITPNEAIGNVSACSSENGNPILVSINKLEEEGSGNIPYIGEALPFNKTMQIKEYKTIPNFVNSQAGTVYGDFLVVALAMDEVAAGNPNGHLYNITTGEHVSNLSFGNTLNGETYKMPHGNQICFGKEFYDENSVFPLLYVSQTTLYENEANKGELGVLVYDIQKVSDTEYTPVLVQAIIPDLSNQLFRDKISKWTTNYVVDTDNDKLYLVGYPRMWDWSDIHNSVKGYYPISKFALPKVSDGEEIVLTNSMLEDNYQIYRETAVQMMLYYRGKVYIQGGFNGSRAPKYLDAVDLCSHSIVSQINLSSVRTLEPQGLFVYDNKLLWYDAGTSGKIDELIF